MAIFTGTYKTYEAKGQREDLADIIYNVAPTDTPFISAIGRGKSEAVLHEWQTDSLRAATTDNAQLEGDDYTSFPTLTPSVRVGNYAQISRELILISGTLEAVNKAGRKSEEAYQTAKAGKQMKRDMETIALANLSPVSGGATTARQTGTMGAWLKTNVNFNTTDGANPTYTSGLPGTSGQAYGRLDGTARAFTEPNLKDAILQMYSEGAELKLLMVGPVNKQKVSAFTGIATRNYDLSNPKPTAVIAAVDVYVSDFGTLKVVPNRFQRERDAWLVDPDYAKIFYLRSFRTEALAKTGDAKKKHLIAEWGLRVDNEAAHGLVADLTTTA